MTLQLVNDETSKSPKKLVKCCICGMQVKRINKHLRKHGCRRKEEIPMDYFVQDIKNQPLRSNRYGTYR